MFGRQPSAGAPDRGSAGAAVGPLFPARAPLSPLLAPARRRAPVSASKTCSRTEAPTRARAFRRRRRAAVRPSPRALGSREAPPRTPIASSRASTAARIDRSAERERRAEGAKPAERPIAALKILAEEPRALVHQHPPLRVAHPRSSSPARRTAGRRRADREPRTLPRSARARLDAGSSRVVAVSAAPGNRI